MQDHPTRREFLAAPSVDGEPIDNLTGNEVLLTDLKWGKKIHGEVEAGVW